MAIDRKSVKRSVFRFRIELRNIAPPIWRGIGVPGSYSFWDLHIAIRDAMGWLDYHSNALLPIAGENGSSEREIGIPVDDELMC